MGGLGWGGCGGGRGGLGCGRGGGRGGGKSWDNLCSAGIIRVSVYLWEKNDNHFRLLLGPFEFVDVEIADR